MGGSTSKPKDSDTRKLPQPAARMPHAPPEMPVEETIAQEKKDGNENKETAIGGVSEQAPEVKEVPVEATKEVENVVPKTEEKEVAEAVVAEDEKKEVAATEAPKEEKKEVAEAVVPNEKKKEVAEAVVREEKKEEMAA